MNFLTPCTSHLYVDSHLGHHTVLLTKQLSGTFWRKPSKILRLPALEEGVEHVHCVAVVADRHAVWVLEPVKQHQLRLRAVQVDPGH